MPVALSYNTYVKCNPIIKMTDELANQAAHDAQPATGGNFHLHLLQGHTEDFKNKFWPKYQLTQHSSRGEEKIHWKIARDSLNLAVSNTVILDKLSLGRSNQDSACFKAMQDMHVHTAPEYSDAFWNVPEVSATKMTNLLKPGKATHGP